MRGSSEVLPQYSMELRPWQPDIPFRRIVREWSEARFAAGACQNSLEQIVAENRSYERFFDAKELRTGGFGATEDLHYGLYRQPRRWYWGLSVAAASTPYAFRMNVSISDLPRLCGFIRSVRHAVTQEEFGLALKDLGVAQRIANAPSVAPVEQLSQPHRWPPSDLPGIYRREHASVLVRSETTTIVVDPQVLAGGWTTNHGHYPADQLPQRIDAVLVTHHHDDHWHLPSILHLTNPDTPVIVPDVPRPNMLCGERFTDSLASIGQAAIIGNWGSTVTVGDIEIDILPFRGEQPTRGDPGPPAGLRNWGNCFRVNTPDFSAVILADSGVDPSGDICPVLESSVQRRGPVDFLLSNCMEFPEGINLGLPHYSLALPFERLQQIFAERQKGRSASMTFGPSGIAEACSAAQARYFLPYAHGFRGVGLDPVRIASEAAVLAEVEQALRHRTPRTQVVRWFPGSSAALISGNIVLHHP
jgi:L-ascorbate metabolism protein UlaG (beta-lactamase superfamily)